MKKNILLVVLILFVASVVTAQKGKLIKADKFYKNYSFEKAIEKYEGIKEKNTDINRKLADSYFKIGDFDKAEEYYQKVVNATDNKPEDYYNYASVLMMNKKYSEAEEWFKKYKKLNPKDSRAEAYVSHKGFYKKLQKDNGQFRIKNLDINTAQSDFGTNYFKDKVVFASSREGVVPIKRRWNWNGLPFLNLYEADKDGVNELTNVRIFDDAKINKKYHEGPACFNKSGDLMILTRNNYKEKDTNGVVRLELFIREFKDDKWQKAYAFQYNNPNYSVGHASLTADGKTMYFASDMPGGYGGVDIYKTTRNEDGTWTKPVNMGDKINTEGDEMFPFIHESEKMLFFASNGHVGLGGLDNFVAQLTSGNVGKVENLGFPVNTNFDDFAFVLDQNEKGGFFSSNRADGKGDDDIYSYKLIKPFVFGKTIKGTAKDKSGNILAGTKVLLYDNDGNVIDSAMSNEKGEYLFLVDADKEYSLTGTKEKYFDAKNQVNTKTEDNIIIADLILEKDPGLSLYGVITDKKTKSPLDSVHVVLIDNFTGKTVLDIITKSTGDFRQALKDKKLNDRISYQIKLEKEGYLGKTVTFNKNLDKPGIVNITEEMDISLEKIEVGADLAKIIDIKPIYFDLNKYNIRPDAAKELDKIVKVMKENPKMEIELGSHTDSRGSAASNLRLSDKRAKASAAYIVKQGIDKSRITGKGYGESKPMVVTKEIHEKYPFLPEGQVLTEKFINSLKAKSIKQFKQAHQLNRRTEFIIVKM